MEVRCCSKTVILINFIYEYQCGNALLKRYSGVNLIHSLTQRETVLDSLSRDKVCRPLANVVLSTSETTAQQHYIAVNGFKYKLPSKNHK